MSEAKDAPEDSEQELQVLKSGPYVALGISEFRYYLGIRLFITFAYQMQAVLIGWQIYILTHNQLALGMVGLAEAIPAMAIALFAGHFADHSDRKKMVFKVMIGMLACSGILMLSTSPLARHYLSISLQLFFMFLMIFCNGICRGFFAPSSFSLFGTIVPRSYYANASTWSSTAFQVSSILGPAAGGLILGYLGITPAFGLIVLSTVIATVFLLLIANKPPEVQPKKEQLSILESLGEGIHFVFNNKMMLGALSLDLFSVLFGGATALLPVYAMDILHIGAKGLGYLRSAPAVGSLLAMVIMLYKSPIRQAWRNLLLAVFAFGLATVFFAVSKNLYLSLFALFLTGAFDSVSVIIRSTILQILTPDTMRGRVSAVNTMFLSSSNEIGAFESGAVASLIGTVPSVVFGGSMVFIIVAFTYYKTRDLLKMRF